MKLVSLTGKTWFDADGSLFEWSGNTGNLPTGLTPTTGYTVYNVTGGTVNDGYYKWGIPTGDTWNLVIGTGTTEQEIQNHVNKMYDQYAVHFHNTSDHRWQIKQEYVAKSGLWIAKKRYAQWVIFKEGKPTNKMDIKGLDVVRSSFPTEFKTIMKETLWYVLKEKSKNDTTNLIMDFKNKIQDSPILDVMKNTGVKNITKYTKGRKTLSGYPSGTPIHVKGAILYNDMLNKFMLSIRNTGTFAFPSYQLLSGAGGKFNNSAMYDKDGYSLFTNVNGVSPGYLQSLAPSGPALILNGTTLTVLKKCNSLFTN